MELIDAMRRANQISISGLGITFPNPIVGAVILSANGEFISEGFHARENENSVAEHAEVVALKAAGDRARGATLLVTLEPCNHHGKTPPCTDAIIRAGISRVIYALDDPHDIAHGGAAKLKAQGIDIQSGLCAQEVKEANRAWLHKILRKRSFVTAKVAATIDGYIAASDGSSKWITSQESRRDVYRLRHEMDALITGTGTVATDNPRLTVRELSDIRHQPERIIVGRRPLDTSAMIFNSDAKTTRIATRNLDEVMQYCFEQGFNNVLLEAGPTLITAFISAGLIDELFIYQAPTILGSGLKMIDDLGIQNLSDRRDFKLKEASVLGEGQGANTRIHLIAAGVN